MFLKLFYKTEMDGKLADLFYEAKNSYTKTR